MNGTVPQKIARVVTNLMLNPHYVPRCLVHNVKNGKSLIDLEIPWFSYSAIDFLDEFLTPDMKVCEYGSGGSTFFFARRVKLVFSIEHDQQWFSVVSKKLREKSLYNVDIALCPFDFKNPEGFHASAYLHAMPKKEKFDVIVIDGAEEWIPVRPACFYHAEKHVKPGGIIVLNDSWRYQDLRQRNKANRYEVFKSVGPCRPGVTSTDIFFY